MKKHRVYFQNEQDKRENTPELRALIRGAVAAALDYEGIRHQVEVSVLLTDNEGIRVINREQRNIDKATDVLSFPLANLLKGEPAERDGELLMLGDVVLSLERAAEQAEEYGHSFEREAAFLTVHSILHLIGYDHIEEEDRVIMRPREEAILSSMGLSRN